MLFSNIIILGPTSSGKTELAIQVAKYLDIPIFNSDAVQVYEGLDKLTNKPKFSRKTIENGEVVNFLDEPQRFDELKWKDCKFTVLRKTAEDFSVNVFDESRALLSLLEQEGVFSMSIEQSGKPIKNYLFDAKRPLESYSLSDWKSDLSRIVENSGIASKIIVGGSIYYAYHYIFGTKFEENFITNEEMRELRNKVVFENIDSLVHELRKKDLDALNLIDINNKHRVAKAIEFIRRTGRKFSQEYYKETDILKDFLIIMILPKNKEEYYQKLDEISEERINEEAFEEIRSLILKYGEDVIPWLEKISYEYKYAIRMMKQEGDVEKLIQELKFEERHYAKRQMTFMRKLEKDLLGKVRSS